MSMFDSLTGPKWQHDDPQVRKNAISQLDDADVLLELVRTDPDAGVQSAALSRIVNPDTLDALIETLPQTLQQQARSQRLQQLLPTPDRLAAIEDDAILVRIISLCDDADLIAAAIARISSDAARMQIAGNHPVAKVRLNAALGIVNMELLSELMQQSRGRDKVVFRHCKTLVDEHHAGQLAAAQRQEKIQQLIDQAGELVTAVHSPDYENNYRVLMAQWRVVKSSASPVQQEQFERDQTSCAQRLVRLADARAAKEQAAADLAAVSEIFPAIIAELEQIDAIASLPHDRAAITQLGERLDDIETRWQAAQKKTRASREQTQTCRHYVELWRSALLTLQGLNDKASRLNKILGEAKSVDPSDYHALQRQIQRTQKLMASLPWPESHSAHLPAQIVHLQQAQALLQSQLSTLQEDQPKHIARLQKLLGVLHSELNQDHSKEADRALGKARRSLKSLAPKQRQQLEQEMQPLAARLKEVDDWRDFAVEPKKVDLCTRMSALIGSEEDVEILAAKIAFLQDEWKQLGTLPHLRDQALWNEFKTAADEAWKPCKAAFAQQARLRRQNYAKRMQVVAQLTEYEEKMAWPQPEAEQDLPGKPPLDWRMVQKTLDIARETFRGIKPVDQRAERVSHKAFRTVCDRVYSHIKQEYQRNISRKEQLLTQALAFSAMEDLPQAIEQCKRIQQDWKAIGITPVGIDRKLWKAFRAACDAVFARMDEQRAQHNVELDARVKLAESLRDQARALLTPKDDDLGLQLQKALSEITQQLREIQLPASVQQRLAKDFQAMERQAREVSLMIRSRREQACWTYLLEKMTACALKTADENEATTERPAEGELPRGIDTGVLEAFWQQGPSDGLEEQLREACIALEILGEIDSPAEDKKARMNFQMQRLVTGLGRGKDQPEPSLEERINAFMALRPSSPWVDRFCLTLEKIRK